MVDLKGFSKARFGVLALAVCLHACAASAPAPAPAPDATKEAWKALEIESLLGRLETLEALMQQHEGDPSLRYEIGQPLSWAQAEAGDTAGAHRSFHHFAPQPIDRPTDEQGHVSLPGPPLDGYAPVDALQALGEAADSAQVIMINEAHHVPQHRAFTLQLLGVLRQKGFKYFAAETLTDDPGLAARGYPTPKGGYYLGEPLYGDLVRTALRLGYRVVPYEAADDQRGDDREIGEVKNLQKILAEDPRAKILVHAGYDHVEEIRVLGQRRMASFFKERTGIDPLTIRQDWMTEQSEPKYEAPAYRQAVEAGLVTRPVVFRNAAGKLWTVREGIDVTLFHPRSVYENGRPTWLRMGGLRSPFVLPQDICGSAPRCLVRAWYAAEGLAAVPVDQTVVAAGQPAALMLPAGELVVKVEDATGKVIGGRTVRMP